MGSEKTLDKVVAWFRQTGRAMIYPIDVSAYHPEFAPKEDDEELLSLYRDERCPHIHGGDILQAFRFSNLIYKYNGMMCYGIANLPTYEAIKEYLLDASLERVVRERCHLG